jgi:anthranilate synthase component II
LKILLIDNYDSFTYNLVHYLEGLDCEVDVVLNDQINFESIETYDKLLLSPGPGLPAESGDLMKVIQEFSSSKPILGVCLGFQALVQQFGGDIYNQDEVKHGRAEKGKFDSSSKLFAGIPEEFKIGLYHSWAAKKENFPPTLKITGESENDIIMAFEHESLPIAGVQFHPESILTENGKAIIHNFLSNFN